MLPSILVSVTGEHLGHWRRETMPMPSMYVCCQKFFCAAKTPQLAYKSQEKRNYMYKAINKTGDWSLQGNVDPTNNILCPMHHFACSGRKTKTNLSFLFLKQWLSTTYLPQLNTPAGKSWRYILWIEWRGMPSSLHAMTQLLHLELTSVDQQI